MIEFRRLRRLAVLIAIVFVAAITGGSESPETGFVSVSIPALHVAAGERVVGFEFDVTAGRIARVPDVPIGWDISVDNDPSWNTKITGSIVVAAAAVDTSFFKKGFLVIEERASPKRPFAIHGEIDVSKDFSNMRKIHFRMGDLTLTPVRITK